MGMFDYIRYKDNVYQTRDTPAQLLDNYEIRNLGSLWHEDYDAEWVDSDESLFGGYLEKKNVRWVFCNFTGEIKFYRNLDKEYKIWEEYSAYFHMGWLRELNIIGINNE